MPLGDSPNSSPKTYRLGSSGLVFAPGVVRAAVETYKANPNVSVRLLADGWGLPNDVARKVCSRDLPYKIEGDTVVIVVPEAINIHNGDSGCDGEFVERSMKKGRAILKVRSGGRLRSWAADECTVYINGRVISGTEFYVFG